MRKLFIFILSFITIVTLIVLLNWKAIDNAIRNKVSETVDSIITDEFQLPEKEEQASILEYVEKDRILIANGLSDLTIETQNPLTESVKAITNKKDFIVGINGGFFLQDLTHAGFLNINGTKLKSLAPLDKQLTGVFEYNNSVPKIHLVSDLQNKTLEINNGFAFQTGPIILLENEPQQEFIKNSINGEGKYIRSFIGFDSNNSIFIGVTKVEMDLVTLANEILKYFPNEKINVINLDGGTSTSIYSSEDFTFDFRSYKTLPFVILGK